MLRFAIKSLEEFYVLGITIAALHFIDTRPDWSQRLFEGFVYSVAWPYIVLTAH